MALRRPASIATDGEGRRQAQTLLADLRVQHAGSWPPGKEQVVSTVSPETALAPLMHIDGKGPAFPMSAEAFLRNSWLMWGHEKCRTLASRRASISPSRRLAARRSWAASNAGASPAAAPIATLPRTWDKQRDVEKEGSQKYLREAPGTSSAAPRRTARAALCCGSPIGSSTA